MALFHIQELEKDVKIYGSPPFRGVRIITNISQCNLLCICGHVHMTGKPCHHCYHITDAIESTDFKIIHYHFGKNIEYT
jgi:hypothetical protein